MLCLYISLVRSKLDSGSPHKSYLQMLDPVHNQVLRLCLGAFRTSVESLYTDAHKPSLGAGHARLSLHGELFLVPASAPRLV